MALEDWLFDEPQKSSIAQFEIGGVTDVIDGIEVSPIQSFGNIAKECSQFGDACVLPLHFLPYRRVRLCLDL